MRKIVSCLLVLSLMLCCACEKNENTIEISTLPPAETLDISGTMRESAVSTESEAETAPALESKPWLRYANLRYDELPETIHIQELIEFEDISTMVGSIEQRFYEVKAVSDANIETISKAWEKFSGEEIDVNNLMCSMTDKTMALSAVPVAEYADIQTLTYENQTAILTYDVQTESLNISRKDFPQEAVSVYTQTTSLINYPLVELYDEETQKYWLKATKDERFAYREDSVKLKGKEVTLAELLDYICEFLYTIEYYDGYITEEISPFYTSDYKSSGSEGTSLEIQNLPDGNQAVIFKFGFTSRDIPIIREFGTDSGETKKVTGTTLEIGMFRKDEIGYIRTNYFMNKPTQIQLTDPRPKMNAPVMLIDSETAIQLADEALTEERTLISGKLQYATEEIYDKQKKFQGYVLTPVYHFAFVPTEREVKKGYSSMFIDVDAVTSEVLKWYSNEPEQSGEKCWKTNPSYYEMEEGSQ